MSGISFSNPWKLIVRRLDATGMYRTVTLALLTLVVISVVVSILKLMPYSPLELLFSLIVAVGVALLANLIFARLCRVSANHESALITALIIFFLILPPQLEELQYLLVTAAVVVGAIASKYIIVWRKQHLLNPAAAGVVAVMLVYEFFPLPHGYFEANWWIGLPILLLPLVLVGSLVVQKVRKWVPVVSFVSVAFIFSIFETWRLTGVALDGWYYFFTSGPSLFLAFFMLTEPFTLPPTKKLQGIYGAFVGFLSQTLLFSPWLKVTPEVALLLGNVIFYPFSLRQKLFLKLKEKHAIGQNTYEFVFEKPAGLRFLPGQYLEWMLPHASADARGKRRYFTIASAPTEADVRLGLKVSEKGSSYKTALLKLDVGESVIASQLAGDFILPKSAEQKLGFIAGGIGITPFRSHLKHMIDSGHASDAVLYYCNSKREDIAYQNIFEMAKAKFNFEVVHVIAEEEVGAPFEQGFVTAEMLKRRTPDYLTRHWYLSGPPGMVNAYNTLLLKLGVPHRHITKDFFPGLA